MNSVFFVTVRISLTIILAVIMVGGFLGTPQAEVRGTIRGVVIADNQDEIAGVAVRLLAIGIDVSPLSTTSDSAGRFQFRDVPAGRYQVTFQTPLGFFSRNRGSNVSSGPLAVSRETPAYDIAMSILRAGALRGQLKSSDGKPLAGVTVIALQSRYDESFPTLGSRTNDNQKTNDRGEYRIANLPPGEYYIGAYNPEPAPRPTSYASDVYFPGTVDASTATPVSVTPGQELAADFTIPSTPGVKLSIKIVNSASGLQRQTPSCLQPVPRNRQFYPSSSRNSFIESVQTAPNEFLLEVPRVFPGTYDLFCRDGNLAQMSKNTIVVGERDIDVVAMIRPGKRLSGRVVMRGAGQIPPNTRVLLRNRDLVSVLAQKSTLIRPDGTFEFESLSEDFRYTIGFSGQLPAPVYVADMRQGTRSIYESASPDIRTPTPEPVEITLASGGGRVNVALRNDKGEPNVMPGSTVALVPEARRGNAMLYKRLATGNNWEVTFNAVAPGEYRVFAWESMPYGFGSEENPEFLARFESRGNTVSVNESLTVDVPVTLIPASETHYIR